MPGIVTANVSAVDLRDMIGQAGPGAITGDLMATSTMHSSISTCREAAPPSIPVFIRVQATPETHRERSVCRSNWVKENLLDQVVPDFRFWC